MNENLPRMTATAPGAVPDDLRFGFGRNWARFLRVLTDERIAKAERSLAEMLGVHNLEGRSFLDAGSGSGLFSLAARRLGAARVHSFDYDSESVACTRELKRRFFALDAAWTIEQGSVLDARYVESLGTFDVVYSWGVLHHTGDMWRALEQVANAVSPGGLLYVALYNDQGATSQRWRLVKRLYNQAPSVLRPVVVLLVQAYFTMRGLLGALVRLGRQAAEPRENRDASARGMSRWHDLVDWVGGYPFEVAMPEAVFDFCRMRGFSLCRLRTVGGGLGNNEFVFARAPA